MGKLINVVGREVVYKECIVRCEMADCQRLLYPGMHYMIVEGEAFGGERKKICDACFDKAGWKYPDVQR